MNISIINGSTIKQKKKNQAHDYCLVEKVLFFFLL